MTKTTFIVIVIFLFLVCIGFYRGNRNYNHLLDHVRKQDAYIAYHNKQLNG